MNKHQEASMLIESTIKGTEKWCVFYLVHIDAMKVKLKSLENEQVVKYYINVICNDLRLPPIRELELGIKLILQIASISKASYCMVPAEQKSQRNRSKDLQVRGSSF